MTGQEYEVRCARYLRRHGFHRVSLTQGSGDQGIDILARRHGKLYGFQCKYYAGSVGNKAVQEAYSGARYYGCDRAAVITNSSFTPSAQDLAESTEVELWSGISFRERKHGFLKFLLVLLILAAVLFVLDRSGLLIRLLGRYILR